jgi:pimeloyl-ACP methyl ester carboxylesterase
LANNYTVYALDLLGFGLSDKPDIPYTGGMYADLIHDFLQDVVAHKALGIGSALGASYLVNAAVREPNMLDRLVLVNPTGTTNQYSDLRQRVMQGVLDSPVLGTSIYNTITSIRGIEQELKTHDYFDPRMVTPEMVEFLHTTAHQPGSQHAVAAFVAGKLDLPMRMAFTDVSQPVLLIWGKDAYYTPVGEAADLLYRHPQARLEIFDDCGMLPHDEKAGDFIRAVRSFLAEPNAGDMAA